jgi:exopolyphosphatase/guanosine-5'-triphosphate,3'-diphosphate pyrophosphatase
VKSDPTFPEKVASIDIGTNTILLLIAEVNKGVLRPLVEKETIVRLGEGVQQNGILLEGAMERGIQTLTQYLKECQDMGVQRIFAAGTSALREAKNAGDFLKRAEQKLSLAIEVITGEEEAQLSFLAVSRDLGNSNKPIFVVDVGGGSTEFVSGKGNQIDHWVSLPVGSVRFTEQFLLSDPVRQEEWVMMENEISKGLGKVPLPHQPFAMVAVGGTATTLASVELGLEHFIYEKIHHFVLRRKALKGQLKLYRSKTLEERRKISGLFPARADVILAGGAILYFAMEKFQVPSVLISCQGVRYGLIYKKISDCGLGLPAPPSVGTGAGQAGMVD